MNITYLLMNQSYLLVLLKFEAMAPYDPLSHFQKIKCFSQ